MWFLRKCSLGLRCDGGGLIEVRLSCLARGFSILWPRFRAWHAAHKSGLLQRSRSIVLRRAPGKSIQEDTRFCRRDVGARYTTSINLVESQHRLQDYKYFCSWFPAPNAIILPTCSSVKRFGYGVLVIVIADAHDDSWGDSPYF